jgi:hypothetical protein
MAEPKDIQKIEAEDPRWLHYEPAPEEHMSIISGRLTCCEILREIYRATDNPEIKMKCRVATTIAKSMAARITKYEGRNWGKKQYVWNPKVRHQRAKAKWGNDE